MDNLQIVCYAGGTCGDLLTALIDPVDVVLKNQHISHTSERSKLKKHFLFDSTDEKDRYVEVIGDRYKSIPSHDLDYHLLKNHQFITITVSDTVTAEWAASRFRNLHHPRVWQEMMQACGAKTVEEYAQTLIDYSRMVMSRASIIIRLEDICAGLAINVLTDIFAKDLPLESHKIYDQWLQAQKHYG